MYFGGGCCALSGTGALLTASLESMSGRGGRLAKIQKQNVEYSFRLLALFHVRPFCRTDNQINIAKFTSWMQRILRYHHCEKQFLLFHSCFAQKIGRKASLEN